jgi:sec-independent protein translocase protein TatC
MGKEKKKKKKKQKPQDPQDTTMSLGDHLEELRSRLILAITGLLIGTGISLLFGTQIIEFIEGPYDKVYKAREAKLQEEERQKAIPLVVVLIDGIRQKLAADPNTPDIEPKTEEFVSRFCTEAFMALFNDPNFSELQSPGTQRAAGPPLIVLSPAAGIISYIKIALITGLLLSSPWVFYQIWMFVAAGLYAHERKYVHTAVPFSAALFVTGALFFIFVVAPLTLKFLVSFNESVLGARSNFTFADYISFVTMLMLVFGIAFQTPIAIFFLNRTGLVSIQSLRKSRKFVFLGIFIAAAMATPPDVISQVTLGIPIYILFELGILLSVFSERKQNKQEETSNSVTDKTDTP